MANFNKVLLIGNLTRDPELRYVPSGAAVINFRLAVNRFFTDQLGERKQDTCFITVVAWKKLAEICSEHLSKGSSVFVEGRLQNRTWETDNKEKRSTIEVVADRIQFLDKKTSETMEPQIPEEISESEIDIKEEKKEE